MTKRPMISAAVTTGLIDAIASAGADPQELLRMLKLDGSVIAHAERFIACCDFARLLEDAARATADEAFGLHFGARGNPKDIGPLAYAVLNAPTITAAFDIAARYLHLHNEAVEMSVSVTPQVIYLRYLHANVGLDEPRQLNEYSMAVILNVLRMMVGSHWVPREAQFAHKAPRESAAQLKLVGAPVEFGCATNALVVEPEFFSRTVPAADPRLFAIMGRYLDDILAKMPRDEGPVGPIRKAIAESLREGGPNLRRVAQRLAVSPRTLQRQLKNYGGEFKQLADETRRQFAVDYLKKKDESLAQIAFLLGYSEVSAFNRAFKRWTGKTPSDFRRGDAG